MKELSIEEKAKAYDEAFEVAQRFYNNSVAITKKGLEDMFPELKENWNEKVRKWLIEMVEEVRKANPTNAEHNGMCSEAIAWIEKQGKQTIEEFARKVTHDKVYAIAFLKSAGIMNEDGQLAEEYRTEADTDKSEQNPAWSEEDEETLNYIIAYIEKNKSNDTIYTKKTEVLEGMLVWLKSLKERVQPQPKQDWSEGDEKMLNGIIEASIHHCYLNITDTDWLKSLKDRYSWKPSDEQMAVLNEVINYAANSELQHWSSFIYTILKSLREQLKKLREE